MIFREGKLNGRLPLRISQIFSINSKASIKSTTPWQARTATIPKYKVLPIKAWESSFTNTGNPVVGTVKFINYPLNYGFEFGRKFGKFDVGLSIRNNTINGHYGLIHTGMVGFNTMYKIGL